MCMPFLCEEETLFRLKRSALCFYAAGTDILKALNGGL